MCEERSKCCPELCPEEKDAKECSPEQIKKCHPEAKGEHPCEDEPEAKPKE